MKTGKKTPKVKLKRDDEVIVLAGKDKGKRGRIMFIDRMRQRVVVQGINTLIRFQRRTQENPQGGRIAIERPLALSNVAFYDSKSRQGKRLGCQWDHAGKKSRAIRDKGALRELRDKEKENN